MCIRSKEQIAKCISQNRCAPEFYPGATIVYTIYKRSLSDNLEDCLTSFYADDTALYTTANSHIELMLTLRLELSVVNQWLAVNKPTLNTSKTKYVIFGKKHQLCQDIHFKLEMCAYYKVSWGNTG